MACQQVYDTGMSAAAFPLSAALIAFSFSHAMWLSALLLAAAGFGIMIRVALCNTLLQAIPSVGFSSHDMRL
jgi:energy-converting hydrogenase Eha subunit G